MPHIRVRNETGHTLHAGFNILGMKNPTRHRNALQPGESFDAGDFPGLLPQSFEVRRVDGQPFHDREAWEQGSQIAAAGVLGGAAVGTGVFGAVAQNGVAMGAAGVLWTGAQRAGQGYGQNAPGLWKRVYLWVWSLHEMEVVIREGEQGLEIWSGGKML
ncbi:hypothetical protein AURDEDRAFT_114445 [Auricularia subglabra TFB-10046 SS5]|nr:hypothetical protein AURDEDRAFT_114445 [Auricularia subglabra TFB-10046 SS5]